MTDAICVQNKRKKSEIVRMTGEELRAIREGMHYSMANFCILLGGIPKSTLQRYENNTAAITPELAERVLLEQTRDADFMERTRQDTRDWCDKHFPHGIPSGCR